MNRNFRTLSAFMRSMWLIEPTFAEAHIPFIQSYIAGDFNPKAFQDDEDEENEESGDDRLSRVGYAVSSSASASERSQTRYGLEDPELPDDSIFVLDIRGAIFKESTCCSIGTEEYCQLLNLAYAHEKIIGIVCLIDSPGGQLSGTPTLYDAIRNPQKPTVSVINEGLMASAAYWLACGSDDIYATQKSDQVGSIGVYVQFEDNRERKKQLGITTHTIYSDRSSEKNRPFREALDGNPALLREDLNQAADLFREAVEQGRGARIKPVKKGGPDVFQGGLFYASQAIELGLIDGFGNLDTAVNRVVELHQARQQESPTTPLNGGFAITETPAAVETVAPAAPAPVAATEPEQPAEEITQPVAAIDADPQPTTTQTPTKSMAIFGYVQLAALAAIKGTAAEAVTEEQTNAINAELASGGFNVHVISQADFAEVQNLQAQLTTANGTIAEKDKEIARLGKQPGAFGSTVEKTEETITPTPEAAISETDAELKRLKGNA
ncbi:S49 family peptidase [Spirosoma sp. BT702]|uniref:S49 family peptidase n=1 Tax=Spirosoma profusum TaxID=2771354 RepID=A0A926XTN5_9BACT|nr:S49 family peptidase [Spirosoma profusum]MBD2700133.1 S49 family peptidase [Spirosoma profusum]